MDFAAWLRSLPYRHKVLMLGYTKRCNANGQRREAFKEWNFATPMNLWESSIQHGTYREVCLGSMHKQNMYSGSKDVEMDCWRYFSSRAFQAVYLAPRLTQLSLVSETNADATVMILYCTVPRSKHIKAIPQKMQRFATIKTGRCFLMFFICLLFFFSQLNQKRTWGLLEIMNLPSTGPMKEIVCLGFCTNWWWLIASKAQVFMNVCHQISFQLSSNKISWPMIVNGWSSTKYGKLENMNK